MNSFPGDVGPLQVEGDLAAQMVDGIGRYLDRAIEASVGRRPVGLPAEERRRRLARYLGVPELAAPSGFTAGVEMTGGRRSAEVARGRTYGVYAVRWAAFERVHGEGLLLVPDQEPLADVIAMGHCDLPPEACVGLSTGVFPEQQFPRRLAEQGCRVLVPRLLSRDLRYSGHPKVRRVPQPHREFVYRAAYQLGHHIIGYELAVVLSAAGLLGDGGRRLGIIGYGEGGLLALCAGALDERFEATGVSGYFGSRQRLAEEPIDRNVWRLLAEFGDAELAALIAPRAMVIEAATAPEWAVEPTSGPTPGRLRTPPRAEIEAELERLGGLVPGYRPVLVGGGDGPPGGDACLEALLRALDGRARLHPPQSPPAPTEPAAIGSRDPEYNRFVEYVAHNEHLLVEAEYRRRDYWSEADWSSPEAFIESAKAYRRRLWEEVIGALDDPLLPPRPRSRPFCDTSAVTGHEVVLEVFPDVFAYGILLVPKDVAPGERRPVVVCQHGLEGRPQRVADPGDLDPAYHRFAYRLAERGFVTFAPQNPYIGTDRFRLLQRKANPLGLSLFSFITRQHEQILNWLGSLPFVDPQRIGFYGISYGGKTAMRVPALLEGYCLSICSADYNEWIWKCASSRHPYSYLFTGEYEMFEFNLGNTFNHAEMSWLIFPRPFMVERGHHDGVAPDEWVGYEFAKSYRLYSLMGVPERCEIEVFDGPHTIHGEGTFRFLHRWLNWPEPGRR